MSGKQTPLCSTPACVDNEVTEVTDLTTADLIDVLHTPVCEGKVDKPKGARAPTRPRSLSQPPKQRKRVLKNSDSAGASKAKSAKLSDFNDSQTMPVCECSSHNHISESEKPRTGEDILRLQSSIDSLQASMQATVSQSVAVALAHFETRWTSQTKVLIEQSVESKLGPINSDIEKLRENVNSIQSEVTELCVIKNKMSEMDSQAQSVKDQINELEHDVKHFKDITSRLDSGSGTEFRQAEFDSMRDRLKNLEKIQHSPQQLGLHVEENVNIVVKNLPEIEGSEDIDGCIEDQEATEGLVNDLLVNGLDLKDIAVVKAVRKPRWGSRPGVITATLASPSQKRTVLKEKNKLRSTEQYSTVYIEPELSLETRTQQRNTRTLLRAMGKESHYVYNRGILVRRQNWRSNREEMRDFYSRIGSRYSRGGRSRGRGGWQYVNSLRARHDSQEAEDRVAENRRQWLTPGGPSASPTHTPTASTQRDGANNRSELTDVGSA